MIDIIRLSSHAGFSIGYSAASWKIATNSTLLEREQLDSMTMHPYTDEVFILIRGNCILYSFIDNQIPESAILMEKNKLYVVGKGIWHAHILDKDSEVLIIEDSGDCITRSIKLREETISLLEAEASKQFFKI